VDETAKLIQELTDAALGRRDQPLVVAPVDRRAVEVELGVIDQHGALDTMPDPAGSLTALKRAVLRLAGFNWARQRAVNHSVGESFRSVLAELDETRALTAQYERRASMAAAASAASAEALQASTERELRVTGRRVDETLAELATLRAGLQTVEVELASTRAELNALAIRLLVEQRHTEALRRELAHARDGSTTATAPEVPIQVAGVDEMYSRFEAAFRPSDDELDARFSEYLDVVEAVRERGLPLIDVGAGRGEFVELLARHSIDARGIDLNADAVDEARRRGRPVEYGDAVAYLRSLDSESIGAVTAFHIVEHLDPATVLELLDETLRVLRPDGIVVIETPNPTNVTVGAAAFYQDPTHLRPMVPAYLEFVLRDRGFADVEMRFLHPLPDYDLELIALDEPGGAATMQLLDHVQWALRGPQDYAAIARRPATR
jgi:2-polyprenyl-3-methyl-5-hydroxy-6-metoxy-1,4-benzoquinol methylase